LQGRPLASVAPSLKEANVAKHLAKGREFTLTGEIAPPSGRRMAFRLSIAPKRLGPEQFLVAEVQNISRLKEQELLLDSYSRMVERKARETEKERQRRNCS
jgi:adenylate cyclase